MTKKKTPTPVKKAAPKKKATEPKGEWKMSSMPVVDIPLSELGKLDIFNENKVKELEAENYALKTLLSKHQSEPMQQLSKPLERTTMLSQFAEAFDGQLSRLYNSLNTLDSLANRLVLQKQDGVQEKSPEPHDLSTRLSNLLAYFSQQNDRLDLLNAKLSDLI